MRGDQLHDLDPGIGGGGGIERFQETLGCQMPRTLLGWLMRDTLQRAHTLWWIYQLDGDCVGWVRSAIILHCFSDRKMLVLVTDDVDQGEWCRSQHQMLLG